MSSTSSKSRSQPRHPAATKSRARKRNRCRASSRRGTAPSAGRPAPTCLACRRSSATPSGSPDQNRTMASAKSPSVVVTWGSRLSVSAKRSSTGARPPLVQRSSSAYAGLPGSSPAAASATASPAPDGGTEHLHRVVQRRLLADHYPADGKLLRTGQVGEMLEDVTLAGAESTPDQQVAGRRGGCASMVEQLEEAVLHLGLPAPQGGDRIPARHAGAQRLDGTPGGQPVSRRDRGHRTASSRVSSRTSAANGLGRRRSRTSSTIRSCNARYAGSPRTSSVSSSGTTVTAAKTPRS